MLEKRCIRLWLDILVGCAGFLFVLADVLTSHPIYGQGVEKRALAFGEYE